MRAVTRLLSASTVLVWLAGCAAPAAPVCPSGLKAMRNELLYFGTDIPAGGTVAPQDWQAFVDSTVTPRFPQGLSVWQVAGQWKSQAGPIVKEQSYVLNILHAGAAAEEQAVQDIAQAYKQKFRQEAVLRVTHPACVSY